MSQLSLTHQEVGSAWMTREPEVGQSTVKLTRDALTNGGNGASGKPRSTFEKVGLFARVISCQARRSVRLSAVDGTARVHNTSTPILCGQRQCGALRACLRI